MSQFEYLNHLFSFDFLQSIFDCLFQEMLYIHFEHQFDDLLYLFVLPDHLFHFYFQKRAPSKDCSLMRKFEYLKEIQ